MMLYKPTVTRRRADGSKYTAKTSKWWGRFRHPKTGLTVSVPLKTGDRSAAQLLLSQHEINAAMEAVGKVDRYDAHGKRPLAEHLADWQAALEGAGRTPGYVDMKVSRCRKVVEGCHWQRIGDIASADAWRFIGKLRDTGAKSRTRNHHLGAVRQFTRWLRDEKRTPDDPLAGMKPEAVTDETEAGIFEPDELRILLEATEAGPVRRHLSGFERRAIYQIAVETGFRSMETRTLTWGDLDLDRDPPTARVTVKRAKNRREHYQPLTPGLVGILQRLRALRGQVDPGDLIFPYTPNTTRMARLLRADLEAAGLPETDGTGARRNFHSFRHTFGTFLARAGVDASRAMELMRHSDVNLTLRRYTHVRLADMATGIATLPDLSPQRVAKSLAG